MSNAWFPAGLQRLAGAGSWTADDIRVMLVKSTYTYDSTDAVLSDLGAVDNGRSTSLQNPTNVGGVLDADDISLSATSAVACNALVIFYHTGSDATAVPLLYIDTPSAGLPFTPAAGQTVNITWDNGANKIAKI